jgi:hypothetical protein
VAAEAAVAEEYFAGDRSPRLYTRDQKPTWRRGRAAKRC